MPSGNPCAHLKAGKAIIQFVQLLSSLTLETSHSQFAVYSNALYCRNCVQFNKNYDASVGVLEAGAKHPFPLLHGQNQWRERHQSQRISDHMENVGLVCSAHGLLHISSLNWAWRTRHFQCSWAQDSPPFTLTPAPQQAASGVTAQRCVSWETHLKCCWGLSWALHAKLFLLDETFLPKGGVCKGWWERQDMFLPYFFLLGKWVKRSFP